MIINSLFYFLIGMTCGDAAGEAAESLPELIEVAEGHQEALMRNPSQYDVTRVTAFRLTRAGGKIVDSNGLGPVQVELPGYDVAVLTADGVLRIAPIHKARRDHGAASLAGNQPVLWAGLVKVDVGQLIQIVDQSAAYESRFENLIYFVRWLESRGIDLGKTAFAPSAADLKAPSFRLLSLEQVASADTEAELLALLRSSHPDLQ